MPTAINLGAFAGRSICYHRQGPLSLAGHGIAIHQERRLSLGAWPRGQELTGAWRDIMGSDPETVVVAEPWRSLEALLVMVPTTAYFTAARTACLAAGLTPRWEALPGRLAGGGDLLSLLETEAVGMLLCRTGQPHLPLLLEGMKHQRRRGCPGHLVLWGNGASVDEAWRPLAPFTYVPWPTGDWASQVGQLVAALAPPVRALWGQDEQVGHLSQGLGQPIHPRHPALAHLARCWAGLCPDAPTALYQWEKGQVTRYMVHGNLVLRSREDVWGHLSWGLTPPAAVPPRCGAAGLTGLPPVEELTRWLPFPVEVDWAADQLVNLLLRPGALALTRQELLLELALVRELSRRSALMEQHHTVQGSLGSPPGQVLVTGSLIEGLTARDELLLTLLDVVEPQGLVTLYWDAHGLAPLLGTWLEQGETLESRWPDQTSSIAHLATCLAPRRQRVAWRRPSDHTVAIVHWRVEGASPQGVRLKPGELIRLGSTAQRRVELTVEPMGPYDFGGGPGRRWRQETSGGQLGIICDTRGRPLELPGEASMRLNRLCQWRDSLRKGL